MPEIKPDLTDQSRCISVHWSLPVQCVLPCTHRENWHEAWHPQSRNRIRYRRTLGVFRTEELRDGDWRDLEIPPPGEVCAEPHSQWATIFCQHPRSHNETTWTHRAVVNGCTYTWNTGLPKLTPEQMAQDLSRVRALAAEQLGRVLGLAEEMEARAARILDRDPVENGISAGEVYEAEVERAVAGRILAALAGESAGQPGEAATP
jgi:hypothetical protein